jgi:hypothetical protein
VFCGGVVCCGEGGSDADDVPLCNEADGAGVRSTRTGAGAFIWRQVKTAPAMQTWMSNTIAALMSQRRRLLTSMTADPELPDIIASEISGPPSARNSHRKYSCHSVNSSVAAAQIYPRLRDLL